MSYSLWTFVTLVGIRSASLKLLDEMLSYTFHSTSFIILAFYNCFLFINTAHPNTLVVNMFCLTQKLTDEYMKKIDSIYKQKEKVTSFWFNWWRNTKFSSVLIVWHIICLYFDHFRSCWRFNDCLHTNVMVSSLVNLRMHSLFFGLPIEWHFLILMGDTGGYFVMKWNVEISYSRLFVKIVCIATCDLIYWEHWRVTTVRVGPL